MENVLRISSSNWPIGGSGNGPREALGPAVGKRLEEEDLVAETLQQAVIHLPRFRSETKGQFRLWLRKIFKGRLRQALRKHYGPTRDVRREQSIVQGSHSSRQEPQIKDNASTPSSPMRRRESYAALTWAIDQLKPRSRQVVLLAGCHGLRLKDVGRIVYSPGEVTNPEEAATKCYQRAMQELREVLNAQEER